MENYFKNNLTDITYQSELTPSVLFRFAKAKRNSGGKFAQQTYVVFQLHKFGAHLK